MTIKIISALLILLMSLAGCSGERGSRQPTAKLSSGSEGNSLLSRNNTPSDPLQVCSPAADLHTTADEEEEVKAEDIDRLYEDYKSDLDTKNTGLLILILFRHNPEPLRARVITEILVERLRCRLEEILYTFYKDSSSSLLLSQLKNPFTSAKEKQAIRRILEDRGETIPES
jgi:hypothetical protein